MLKMYVFAANVFSIAVNITMNILIATIATTHYQHYLAPPP